MRKKLTNEDVDTRLNGRYIERCENVESASSTITWRCTRCCNVWWATAKKVATEGTGCPTCSRISGDLKRRRGVEKFTEQANVVHSNKYAYDKVSYTNSHTKVTITCPTHGDFTQTPTSHLSGNGCRKCADDKSRDTIDTFIRKARLVHGDKYDYSQFTYMGSHTRGIITCPTHGDFTQKPNTHICKLAGCPVCDVESRKGSYSFDYFKKNPEEQNKQGYLYVVRLHVQGQSTIKIGVALDVHRRLNYYYGMNKELLYTKQTTLYEAYELEQHILSRLIEYKFYPTQKFDGYTECVKDKQEVITLLEELLVTP